MNERCRLNLYFRKYRGIKHELQKYLKESSGLFFDSHFSFNFFFENDFC